MCGLYSCKMKYGCSILCNEIYRIDLDKIALEDRMRGL
jgi:hypothetical protein